MGGGEFKLVLVDERNGKIAERGEFREGNSENGRDSVPVLQNAVKVFQ